MGVTVDESRAAQASMPPDRYYGSSYYERWLFALEKLSGEKGDTRNVPPEQLAAVAAGLAAGGAKRFRDAPAAPAFAAGDDVRVRDVESRGYDRLPSYVKGHRGAVEEHCGSFAHPEDMAAGRIAEPGAHCYRVRFSAMELWGESAESPGDSLCIDLFENYLEAA